MEPQRDAALGCPLLDGAAHPDIEAVNGPWEEKRGRGGVTTSLNQSRFYGSSPRTFGSPPFHPPNPPTTLTPTRPPWTPPTCERLCHVDVILRNVADAKVNDVQLTLVLSVVTVQDVEDGLHRAVHVTWEGGGGG